MLEKQEIKLGPWGEIISADITKIRKVTPEQFCQVYLQDNREFWKLSGSECKVLHCCWYLSAYYDPKFGYPGNKLTLDSQNKDFIVSKTGIKEGTVNNAISSLVKKGMLIKDKTYKSVYYLTPDLFFKGAINDRTKVIRQTIEYQIQLNDKQRTICESDSEISTF